MLGAHRARGRGDRDHDLVRLGLVEDLGDLLGRAEHLEAASMRIPRLRGVVVDEADRGRAEPRVELQLADDHLPAGAGADDQHLVLGQPLPARGALDDQPHREPGAGDQHQRQEEVHHHDRARQRVLEGLQDREGDEQDRAGDGDGAHDQHEVATADVAPPLLVEPEGGEDDDLDGDRRSRSPARGGPRSAAARPSCRGSADGRPGRRRAPRAPRRQVPGVPGCDRRDGSTGAWERSEFRWCSATSLQSPLHSCPY